MPLVYAPDGDPSKSGVIIAGAGMRPSVNGFEQWPEKKAYGWSALAATATSAYLHVYHTDSRIIAGTTTKLYEMSRTGTGTYTVTDVSKGGGSYTAPSWTGYVGSEGDPGPWAFTSFGAYCIASNKFNTPMQVQTAKGGAFADLTGSPPCSTLTTFKNFVVAGNCGDYGSVTGTNDMVAWSALGDHTNWVPSPTTQAGYQQVLDVPGRIVCVKPLGDAVVVYKESGIWLMRYVGPPNVFSFQMIDNRNGPLAYTLSYTPVIDIGHAHVFVSKDAICVFDGSTVRRLSDGVLSKQYTTINGYGYNQFPACTITHDILNGDLIFWPNNRFDVSNNSGSVTLQSIPAYNYKMGKWGTGPLNAGVYVNCALEFSQPVMNSGSAGTDSFNCHPFFWDADDKLYRIGPAGQSEGWQQMQVWTQVGNHGQALTIRRVMPVFNYVQTSVSPGLAYIANTLYRAKPQGDTGVINGSTGTWSTSRGCFDLMSAGYWHSFGLNIPAGTQETTGYELIDILYDYVPSGKNIENIYRPAP